MFDPNKFWKKQILDYGKDNFGKTFKKMREYKPKYIKGDILTKKCKKSNLITKDKINPWWITILSVAQDIDGVKYYLYVDRYADLCGGVDEDKLDDYEVDMENGETNVESCYDFDRQKYIPYPNSKTEAKLKKCMSK